MPFEIRGQAWDKQYYPEGVCSFTMYLEDYDALKERFPMSRMALYTYETAKERDDYAASTCQSYRDYEKHDVFEPHPPYLDA